MISVENEIKELEDKISDYVMRSRQPTHDLEAIRQGRQILGMFGKWLGENLGKDAVNIYLLVEALRKKGTWNK